MDHHYSRTERLQQLGLFKDFKSDVLHRARNLGSSTRPSEHKYESKAPAVCDHFKRVHLDRLQSVISRCPIIHQLRVCEVCDAELLDKINMIGTPSGVNSYGNLAKFYETTDAQTLKKMIQNASNLNDQIRKTIKERARRNGTIRICLECGSHSCQLRNGYADASDFPNHSAKHFSAHENQSRNMGVENLHSVYYDVFSGEIFCYQCQDSLDNLDSDVPDPELQLSQIPLESTNRSSKLFKMKVDTIFEKLLLSADGDLMDMPQVVQMKRAYDRKVRQNMDPNQSLVSYVKTPSPTISPYSSIEVRQSKNSDQYFAQSNNTQPKRRQVYDSQTRTPHRGENGRNDLRKIKSQYQNQDHGNYSQPRSILKHNKPKIQSVEFQEQEDYNSPGSDRYKNLSPSQRGADDDNFHKKHSRASQVFWSPRDHKSIPDFSTQVVGVMKQVPNLSSKKISRAPSQSLSPLRSRREMEAEQQQLDLVISKAIYDIQHFYNSNKITQEEYKVFFSQELHLDPFRKTCYLQSVLLVMNQVKRFVMDIMLNEDEDSMGQLKAAIQELFANSRKRLNPTYNGVLSVLEKEKPSQYKGGVKLGDTLECIHDILNIIHANESLEWLRKGRMILTDYENLQNSFIFKTFGFRTLQTITCMECEYTSDEIQYHLHLDLPIQYYRQYDTITASAITAYFRNFKNQGNPVNRCLHQGYKNICFSQLCTCLFNYNRKREYVEKMEKQKKTLEHIRRVSAKTKGFRGGSTLRSHKDKFSKGQSRNGNLNHQFNTEGNEEMGPYGKNYFSTQNQMMYDAPKRTNSNMRPSHQSGNMSQFEQLQQDLYLKDQQRSKQPINVYQNLPATADSSSDNEKNSKQIEPLRSRKHTFIYENDKKFVKNKAMQNVILGASPAAASLKINKDMLGVNLDFSSVEYFEPKPRADTEPQVRQLEENFCRMQHLVDGYSQIQFFQDTRLSDGGYNLNADSDHESGPSHRRPHYQNRENLYDCPNCNRGRTANQERIYTQFVMRNLLLDLPENLIINFKRYEIVDQQVKKLKNKVSISKTIFLDEIAIHRIPKWRNDFHEFYSSCQNSQNKYKYNLYAIISHIGRAEIGHYVTYIRQRGNHRQQETWIMYDENSRTVLERNQLFDKNGLFNPIGADSQRYIKADFYQLFYERDDTGLGTLHSEPMMMADATIRSLLLEYAIRYPSACGELPTLFQDRNNEVHKDSIKKFLDQVAKEMPHIERQIKILKQLKYPEYVTQNYANRQLNETDLERQTIGQEYAQHKYGVNGPQTNLDAQLLYQDHTEQPSTIGFRYDKTLGKMFETPDLRYNRNMGMINRNYDNVVSKINTINRGVDDRTDPNYFNQLYDKAMHSKKSNEQLRQHPSRRLIPLKDLMVHNKSPATKLLPTNRLDNQHANSTANLLSNYNQNNQRWNNYSDGNQSSSALGTYGQPKTNYSFNNKYYDEKAGRGQPTYATGISEKIAEGYKPSHFGSIPRRPNNAIPIRSTNDTQNRGLSGNNILAPYNTAAPKITLREPASIPVIKAPVYIQPPKPAATQPTIVLPVKTVQPVFKTIEPIQQPPKAAVTPNAPKYTTITKTTAIEQPTAARTPKNPNGGAPLGANPIMGALREADFKFQVADEAPAPSNQIQKRTLDKEDGFKEFQIGGNNAVKPPPQQTDDDDEESDEDESSEEEETPPKQPPNKLQQR